MSMAAKILPIQSTDALPSKQMLSPHKYSVFFSRGLKNAEKYRAVYVLSAGVE